jgi:hypothetical protein
MEQNNKEVIFTLMVTSPDTLKTQIKKYNNFNGTNFEIIKIIDDEVPFCEIKVSKFGLNDIFNLGFGLALLEESLRQKGEIDW